MSEKNEIRLGNSLKEAWNIFLKGPEIFVAITFLYFAVVFVLGGLPVVGQLISFLVLWLLQPAFILLAEQAETDEKVSFDSLQKLVPLAPQLLALGVVKSLLTAAGFALLFFPGLYVITVLAFVELLVVLKGRSFVEALKESHKLAHENLLGVLGMVAFCWLLLLSGFLLIGLGALVTIPLAVLVPYRVFRSLGKRPEVIIPEVVNAEPLRQET
jgi:uncharacterized membrane protein